MQLLTLQIMLLFLIILHGFSQISSNWSSAVLVPKYNQSSSARGSVGNNMVITSYDRVIIFSEETFDVNSKKTRLISYSFTDNLGTTWNGAYLHSGAQKTQNPFGINIAIDVNDDVHTAWISSTTNKVYYMKFDDNMIALTDTICISDISKTKLTISDVKITVDRKNRVHIFWMDGNAKTQIPEIKYARSTNAGYKWENEKLLSIDDGMKSCFPRADFTGALGDNLAIVWRDSSSQVINGTTYDNWKLMWSLTNNGGKTWKISTAYDSQNSEWDPGLIVDKYNNLHVNYTLVPSFNNKIETRIYSQSTNNKGLSWFAGPDMISANEACELTAFNYGFLNDEIWVFWKNDINGQQSPNIECSYSNDQGNTWQPIEKLTDYDSITNPFIIGYKSTHVSEKGLVAINYDVTVSNVVQFSIYFKYRIPTSSLVTSNLQENSFSSMNDIIYYSPLENEIKISLKNSNENIKEIIFFNSLGQFLFSFSGITSSQLSLNVDTYNLSSGIYYVNVLTDKELISSKIYIP